MDTQIISNAGPHSNVHKICMLTGEETFFILRKIMIKCDFMVLIMVNTEFCLVTLAGHQLGIPCLTMI